MDKLTIISRFEATIEKLKALSPMNFHYGSFIEEHDGGCGTVCCVLGHYPGWFPKSGFYWEIGEIDEGNLFLEYIDGDAIRGVRIYHGFNHSLCECLFYGDVVEQLEAGLPETNTASKLPKVIELFEAALIKLRTGELDEYLVLDSDETLTNDNPEGEGS